MPRSDAVRGWLFHSPRRLMIVAVLPAVALLAVAAWSSNGSPTSSAPASAEVTPGGISSIEVQARESAAFARSFVDVWGARDLPPDTWRNRISGLATADLRTGLAV